MVGFVGEGLPSFFDTPFVEKQRFEGHVVPSLTLQAIACAEVQHYETRACNALSLHTLHHSTIR